MHSLDFVKCPKCNARVWEDLHALDSDTATRFRCIRCGNIISLGACSHCAKKRWTRLPGMTEKKGKKPVVRYRCDSCGRTIGVILD